MKRPLVDFVRALAAAVIVVAAPLSSGQPAYPTKPVRLVVAKGYNHYDVGETIGNPYAVLGRAAVEMMKLTTA